MSLNLDRRRRREGYALNSYKIDGNVPVMISDYVNGVYFKDNTTLNTLAEHQTYLGSDKKTVTQSDGTIAAITDTGEAALDFDPVTLAAKGLRIEPAATNIITQSSDFTQAAWSKTNTATLAGDAIGPDGVANSATTLIDSGATGTGGIFVNQVVTVATTTEYTFSVYVKKDQLDWVYLRAQAFTAPPNGGTYYDLTNGVVGSTTSGKTGAIEDVGNGWYRCSMTFTTHSSDTSGSLRVYAADADADFTVDLDSTSSILMYGAQFETGPVATSYIPTTAGMETRVLDVVSMTTGSIPFTGYNQAEGTMVVWATTKDITADNRIFTLSNGTDQEVMYAKAAAATHLVVIDGGASQASIDAGAFVNDTQSKLAVGYKLNDFAASIDGATVVADASGTIPAITKMYIGTDNDGTGLPLYGHIKRIVYYPTLLTDAQLEELST